MASAWGNSWGGAWGNAWGVITSATTTRDTGAGSGKYRYKDDEIWFFIEQLKRDHRVIKPEPRTEAKLVTKKVEFYYPEVEALLLDIEVARAVGSPNQNILQMINKLDVELEKIEEEEELVELITILH